VEKRLQRRVANIFDRAEWLGPLLLAPAILSILALIAMPFVLALLYSVSDVTTGRQAISFVGLRNFQGVLENPAFLTALKNTFIFTFASQVLVMIFAQIMALALQQTFPGKPVVRFLLLLPWVAPIALGTIGWKWMYDSLYSVINWTLQALHIIGPNTWPYWLGEPDLAMMAVILVHVWRMFPFATVILLAGLTSLPQEVLEAAAVDGTGFWRRLSRFQKVFSQGLPGILSWQGAPGRPVNELFRSYLVCCLACGHRSLSRCSPPQCARNWGTSSSSRPPGAGRGYSRSANF
jgi:ABC-type sugar transport system permease subunit